MAFAEAYEEGEAGAIDEEWRVKVIKAAHSFANRFCGTPSPANVSRAITVLKQVERAQRVLDSVEDSYDWPTARNCDILMLPLIRCAQKFRGKWKLNSTFIRNWSI